MTKTRVIRRRGRCEGLIEVDPGMCELAIQSNRSYPFKVQTHNQRIKYEHRRGRSVKFEFVVFYWRELSGRFFLPGNHLEQSFKGGKIFARNFKGSVIHF